MVPVNFKKKKSLVLLLLVVANKGSTLLGRDWFSSLGIQVVGLHIVTNAHESVVSKFPDVLESLFQELPYRQSASS